MPARLSQKEVEDRLSQYGLILLEQYINRRTKMSIRCICGKKYYACVGSIFYGKGRSCGCYQKQRASEGRKKDISGQKFTNLLAITSEYKDKWGNYIWKCLCDCGAHAHVIAHHLLSGNTKSCGNCGVYRNGVATSYIALELNKNLGRGIHNYQTKCNSNIDIAFVYNGRKIAIEYDCWKWHKDYEERDKRKSQDLINDNWIVLRIKSRTKIPDISLVWERIDSLIETRQDFDEIYLSDWKGYINVS